MKRYQFYTADVFTDRIFGGNPLAVFPRAEGLTSQQMQKIAAEFNLSETVFAFPPQTPEGTRRLRIFTPAKELPFAGHPTIGTACVLAAIGEITLQGEGAAIVLEEGVGAVRVKIRAVAGEPVIAELTVPQMPELGPEPPAIPELAAILSLDPADLLDGELSPQSLSCGVPFLFIPVRDRSALGRIRLERQRWQQLLANYWASSIYVFTTDAESPDCDFRARMFAPALGIAEDPATGAAVAALAGYLAVREQQENRTLEWAIEQGMEMGRPSWLRLSVEKQAGEIRAIRVGGSSVLVSEGTMVVPD
jgi:trans-2,3-dihydro-3-hydroxyanthranilate isomerase